MMNSCAGETATSAPITWAEHILECQEMPSEEISSILATDDVEVVRRDLELHRERLQERLTDRFRELDTVEAGLAARIATSGE
jgi:hypothetical protein